MTNKGLKASEVCSIIKQCKDAGITELKFGELHIQFRPRSNVEQVQSQNYLADEKITETQPTYSDGVDEKTTESMGMMDEQAAEDALYSQLLIEDPAGLEKLRMSASLEDQRVVDNG